MQYCRRLAVQSPTLCEVEQFTNNWFGPNWLLRPKYRRYST